MQVRQQSRIITCRQSGDREPTCFSFRSFAALLRSKTVLIVSDVNYTCDALTSYLTDYTRSSKPSISLIRCSRRLAYCFHHMRVTVTRINRLWRRRSKRHDIFAVSTRLFAASTTPFPVLFTSLPFRRKQKETSFKFFCSLPTQTNVTENRSSFVFFSTWKAFIGCMNLEGFFLLIQSGRPLLPKYAFQIWRFDYKRRAYFEGCLLSFFFLQLIFKAGSQAGTAHAF